MRLRASLVTLPFSASDKAVFFSANVDSDFWSSPSRTPSLWLSEVISWSFPRSSCSSFLFFASASSARSVATSASARRAASFYKKGVSGKRMRGKGKDLFDLVHVKRKQVERGKANGHVRLRWRLSLARLLLRLNDDNSRVTGRHVCSTFATGVLMSF